MKITQELIKSALLGTDRLEAKINDQDLNEIIQFLENSDKETKLLTISGIAFKYNKAGKLPEKLENIPIVVSENETVEICNNKLIDILSSILINYRDLLPVFLENLVKIKKILPDYLLPKILEEGYKNKDLQENILQVVGKRGLWLAKQNKHWDYIFDDQKDINEIWNYQTSQVRINLLEKIRKNDPEKARELLKSSWSEENSQDKVKYLDILKINLSLADEEFLEFTLDDKRSKDVRRKSSELLNFIPDSKLTQRMVERFDKLLEIVEVPNKKKGAESPIKTKLIINVIDKPEPDLIRDIGGEKYELKTYEVKVNFVANNIMNKIPLKYFTDKFQKTPEEIISMVVNNSELYPLFAHFKSQLIKEKNAEWARAFLDYPDTQYLFQALNSDEREKFILKKLNENFSANGTLFYYHKTPWSDEFSYQFMKLNLIQLKKNAEAKKNTFSLYSLISMAHLFSPNINEKLFKDFLPLIDYHSADYNHFTQFLNVLQFRHDMLKEFNQ